MWMDVLILLLVSVVGRALQILHPNSCEIEVIRESTLEFPDTSSTVPTAIQLSIGRRNVRVIMAVSGRETG